MASPGGMIPEQVWDAAPARRARPGARAPHRRGDAAGVGARRVPEARRLAPPQAAVRPSGRRLGALPRRATDADARHLVPARAGLAAARGLRAHHRAAARPAPCATASMAGRRCAKQTPTPNSLGLHVLEIDSPGCAPGAASISPIARAAPGPAATSASAITPRPRRRSSRVPFTLAHPAAILPLRRVWRLRTAPLIIGALIPDLPYYVPGSIGRFLPETHNLEGSVTVCLALGYLALLARVPAARAAHRAAVGAGPLAVSDRAGAAAPSRASGCTRELRSSSACGRTCCGTLSPTATAGWCTAWPRSARRSRSARTTARCAMCCSTSAPRSDSTVMAVWYFAAARAAGPLRHRRAAVRSSVRPVLLLVSAAAVLIGGVQALDYYGRQPIVYRTLEYFPHPQPRLVRPAVSAGRESGDAATAARGPRRCEVGVGLH